MHHKMVGKTEGWRQKLNLNYALSYSPEEVNGKSNIVILIAHCLDKKTAVVKPVTQHLQNNMNAPVASMV